MPTIHAIDLSHHNTVSDFAAVKRAGIVGVIHKASEGSTYQDPMYGPRMVDALGAGLLWGAYHFLKHDSVQSQIANFVQTANLPPGSRAVIDYEDQACTIGDLQEAIQELGAADSTLEICVYAGGLLKGQVSSSQQYPILASTSLWLAQYTSGTPSWPTNIWPAWSLWQYTDSGQVSGIQGAVDCNTFNGSVDACRKWFGPVEPAPSPPPPPDALVVDVAITAPSGVSLSISVNGQVIGVQKTRRHAKREET